MWSRVENKDRRFGSAVWYWSAKAPYGGWLLLTDNELQRAMARWERNPEDVPQTVPGLTEGEALP